MATIKDVARLAGVSTATVSATVNKSAFVSPELKARVEEAVQKLGYAPSTIARSLKMGSTRLLGLIIPDITNPFFTELVHTVEAKAQLYGYTVLLCNSDEDVAKEIGMLRTMQMQRVDGLILAPSGASVAYRQAGLKSYPVPIVLIDRVLPPFDSDAVLIDNHAAAFKATCHLLEHGHRRIATIAGADHLSTGADRIAGFRGALALYDVASDPEMIRIAAYRQDEAYAACRDLMANAVPPTALFVANNLMLIGAMRALADLGIKSPADISLIAVDDMPWMTAFSPKITVIRQPIQAMGQAVVDVLMRRISPQGRDADPQHLVLDPELIVRDSCATHREAGLTS
jgi:LacI family transcriptional regulator